MERVIKILNALCLFVTALWTVPCALLAITGFLVNETWGHAVVRIWAKGILTFLGVRVSTQGLGNVPRGKGMVIAPNHQSNIDIMVLASLPIDFKWVSKTEVARIPLIGAVLRTMGSYLVRRDRSGHDLNVMKEVEEGLRAGKAVLIFPEGTRTRTGSLLPMKKGAFRTAQNAGVPLLPIGIAGTYAIAPPGHLIPPRWGHAVTVKIGTPLTVSPEADVPSVTESFRQTLSALIGEPSSAPQHSV